MINRYIDKKLLDAKKHSNLLAKGSGFFSPKRKAQQSKDSKQDESIERYRVLK